MNVIRMIKLFGWEKKMEERIAEKREEELVTQWKRQIYELFNGNIKLVSQYVINGSMAHFIQFCNPCFRDGGNIFHLVGVSCVFRFARLLYVVA